MIVEKIRFGTLTPSDDFYEFEDIAVTLEDGINLIIEGHIEIEYERDNDSFDHAFGTESFPDHYNVCGAVATITKIINLDDKEITLNQDEKRFICSDIENQVCEANVEPKEY